MTAMERVIGALRDSGSVVDDRNGERVKAQCPAHDDNSPSLSVGQRRDGKGVVINCHAGCDTLSVLQAINFTMTDLFDDDATRAVFTPRRDYKYPDGRVVHRKPNKQFPQSGNLKGNSLFHADRIGDSQTIYVTEGEKDVEAIDALTDAVAVSPPQGAATPPDRFDWSPLRGKDAVIIADRDEKGREHAARVAAVLGGVAKTVRIVEAKAGKDAADHLAAGHTLDELVEAVLPTHADAPEPVEAEEDKPGRRSVAAQLVDMARSEYILGITDTDDPFGVTRDRPHNAMMLRGGRTGLRAELSRRFFAEHNTVPSQQALADACMVLEGFAAQQPPARVYLRVGQCGGAVYIDMCDTDGRVIKVSAGKWTVVDTAPVLFRRTKLSGQLPQPQVGSVDPLWDFVGVDVEDRPLVLAWLVAALVQVDVPHPILALLAEQGSAKSTVTRILVSLIDPSVVPLRQPPRDPDGWTTAASASWVVALDNLSGSVPAWLSDCLCRASTGDGNVKRALYTDSDVAVTAFRRCMIINGVDLNIDRGDLAERILVAPLPRVTTRRSEDELAAAWERTRPGVLGGLLDLAAEVLYRLPDVVVADLPRMADFAKVLAVIDKVLDTDALSRYRDQVTSLATETLDAPFIAELVTAAASHEERTSAELLAALTPQQPDWRRPKDWPKNAKAVTGLLTRHAPALRASGWQIDHDGGQNKGNRMRWTITPPPQEERRAEKSGNSGSPPSPDSSPQVNGHKSGESPETLLLAASASNSSGESRASQASHGESPPSPNIHALTCDDEPASQASQESTHSLGSSAPGAPTARTPGMTSRVQAALANAGNAITPLVTGPGRCHECGCHVATQGHKSECRTGAA